MKSLELARSKCTFRTFSSPFCLTKSLSFCTNDLQCLRSYSTKMQSTKIRWQSGPSTDLLMKSILSPAREYHLSTARLDYMHWTLLGKSSCRSAFLIHLSEYVAGLLTRLWIVQCLGRPIIVHQLNTLEPIQYGEYAIRKPVNGHISAISMSTSLTTMSNSKSNISLSHQVAVSSVTYPTVVYRVKANTVQLTSLRLAFNVNNELFNV